MFSKKLSLFRFKEYKQISHLNLCEPDKDKAGTVNESMNIYLHIQYIYNNV